MSFSWRRPTKHALPQQLGPGSLCHVGCSGLRSPQVTRVQVWVLFGMTGQIEVESGCDRSDQCALDDNLGHSWRQELCSRRIGTGSWVMSLA